MPTEQRDYASDYAAYLLRLWKSNERGNATWRASLESTAEGRRYNFARVEALISFLLERFGSRRPEREPVEDNQSHPI